MAQPIHYGELVRRKSRLTGAIVSVFDPVAQGIDVDGNKYALVCETHGTICGVDTMRAALAHLPVVDWCEACQEVTR